MEVRGVKPLWLEGEADPVCLSVRARLARNIRGFPFPHLATEEELDRVRALVSEAWEKGDFPFLFHFPLSFLSPLEKNAFVEMQIISREFAKAPTFGRAFFASPDGTLSIMVNEEDHLRIAVLGKDLGRCLRRAYALEAEWGKQLPFALVEGGYLTASPLNLGSGLRLSALLHLPALALRKGREGIGRELFSPLEIRGLLGEGSEAVGFFFQISNESGYMNKEEIQESMGKALRRLGERELEEREILFSKSDIVEKISLAYARLLSAESLSTYTATQLIGLIRLGSAMGILDIPLGVLDKLLFLIRPTLLQYREGRKLKIAERDRVRARMVKEVIASR